jgi:hypothetical protein
MKRREFLGVGAAAGVAGLVGARSAVVQAQTPITIAIHFVGLHARVVEKGDYESRFHEIVTMRGAGHSTLMLLQKGNVEAGGLGYVNPNEDLQKWPLTGTFFCPRAVEALKPTTAPKPLDCPTNAKDWEDIRYLFNVTTAGGKMKAGWAMNAIVDTVFQLNDGEDLEGKFIGKTLGEPPFKARDRRAIWKVCGKKQVLTDRFVYRVTTENPTIKGPFSDVKLKLIPEEKEVCIYVVTLFETDPCANHGKPRAPKDDECADEYHKGYKLKHVPMVNALLDGAKLEPKFDDNCQCEEHADVEAAAELPPWLKNRLKIRSSLDTFCPGFDSSS